MYQHYFGKQKYTIQMYRAKVQVRKEFFSESQKRRVASILLRIPFLNKFFQKYIPYSIHKISKNTNYFTDKKIVIYTAIYGGYDAIYEPRCIPDNCEYIIFTDQDDNLFINSKWKKRTLNDDFFNQLSNVEKNRYIKMNPHLLFPDFDVSIYIDGNIEVVTDFSEFVHDFNEYGIKVHNHFTRHSVFEEIDECIRQNKCPQNELLEYKNKLINDGFSDDGGLLECPVICREHHNKRCIEIMEQWWDEFRNCVKRDQIALIYVLFKNGVEPKKLAGLGNDIHSNYSFIQHGHKK